MNWRFLFQRWAVVLTVAVVLWLMLPGCGTVTPAPARSEQASFDGTERNSGVLELTETGAVVTPRARDRYNVLVDLYGKAWAPRIREDHGVTKRSDGNYEMTNEALEKFIVMSDWRRMGRAEPK
ncbi:MAG TPA: hypothetical protein VHF69_00860 [Candidatus Synoicihabitans sp.]|nr:hypothetical protein [Candidatus Synoicihabitans sp.]